MRIKITKNPYSDLYEFEKVADDYEGMNEVIVDISEEQAVEWTKVLTNFEKFQIELMDAKDDFHHEQLEKKQDEERGTLFKEFNK